MEIVLVYAGFFQQGVQHCQTVVLARKWLNVNVSCCLKEANGLSNIFYLEIWPDVLKIYDTHHLISCRSTGIGEKVTSCQIRCLYDLQPGYSSMILFQHLSFLSLA